MSLYNPWITYPVTISIPEIITTTWAQPISGFNGISEGAYQPMLALIGTLLLIMAVFLEIIGKAKRITTATSILAGLFMIIGAANVLLDPGSFASNFTIPPGAAVSAGFGIYFTIFIGAFIVIIYTLRALKILPDPE
ncbi:MAG: hypothetical protein LBE48_03720 [Methanomassiliicoccaceae archaeon]|nr:hypothetical protein [Methanomassiliicoccaceae archaeon]